MRPKPTTVRRGTNEADQTTLTAQRVTHDHLAIMKKSWGLLPKILSGEKTIESRWTKNHPPYWNSVNGGDSVYFKDSGEPVTVKAIVDEVSRFELFGPENVRHILEQWASRDGISPDKIPFFANLFAAKNYCMLIFLRDPQRITPFDIDKTGYGNQVAWITVKSIDQLKAKPTDTESRTGTPEMRRAMRT